MPPAPPPALDEEMDLAAACAIIGCTPDDLIAELSRRTKAKEAKMRREMALAAKHGGERRIVRTRDLGDVRVTFMVHPVSYHFWGQEVGYECWDDNQFVREYLRDNPECRIKEIRNPVVRVGFDAKAAAAKPAAPVIYDGHGRPLH